MDATELFDIPQLGSWLADCAGLTAPLAISRISGGQSNLTFIVTDAVDKRAVLRRPPLGTLAQSAHDVLREAHIMAALADTAVPVPTIFDTSTKVSDQPTVAMSFVPGVAANNGRVVSAMSPQVRGATAASLIDAMTHVHSVDLAAVGLADLASTEPYAPRQLRRWTKQWEKSKFDQLPDLPELDALTKRLEAAIPPQSQTTLVHGDLHLGNLLVAPDTGAALAVVDWELATLGDPLADIGSLMAYWPVRGGIALPGFDAALAEGFPTPPELAEMYLARTAHTALATGTNHTDQDKQAIAFWHVLGVWKVAIIVAGVVRRNADRPENASRSGAPTPDFVRMLVAYATKLADSYAL